MEKICQTCRFASWVTKSDGTVLQSRPGTCGWRAILPVPHVIQRAVGAQVDNVAGHLVEGEDRMPCVGSEGATASKSVSEVRAAGRNVHDRS